MVKAVKTKLLIRNISAMKNFYFLSLFIVSVFINPAQSQVQFLGFEQEQCATELNIKDLKRGLYFIKITIKNTETTIKIMKI